MTTTDSKQTTAGVLTVLLIVTFAVAGALTGTVAAQAQEATVQETTVDADGSQLTITSDGLASVSVTDLPAGSSVSSISGVGAETDAGVLWNDLTGLPETVTFTLTPPEGADTVQFNLNGNSVALEVTTDNTDPEQPSQSSIEGFEDSDLSEYNDVDTAAVTTDTAYAGDQSLVITDQNDELGRTRPIGNQINRSFNQISPSRLTAAIRSDTGLFNTVRVAWKNESGAQIHAVEFQHDTQLPNHDDYIYYGGRNGVELQQAQEETWYYAELLDIDWEDNTIGEIRLNDQVVATNVPFSNPGDSVSSMRLVVHDGGTGSQGFFDEITVGNSSSGSEPESPTGTLTGTVRDQNLHAIADADVMLQQQTNTGEYEIISEPDTTTSSGEYVFQDLSTNENYRVIAEFEDSTGSATIDNLREGTNSLDVIIQEANQNESSKAEITATHVGEPVSAGGSFNVTFELTNTGSEYAPVSTIQFDTPAGVSADTVFFNDGISAGETKTGEVTFEVASTVAPSDYTLTAEGLVGESTATTSVGFMVTESGPAGDIPDKQVALDGDVTASYTPEDESNDLAIQGETAGWTVVSTTPDGGVLVSPDSGAVLGPDDAITNFGTYENGEFSVTLSPPSDARQGETYQFNVNELSGGTVVNSESFSITIGSSVPSWVGESEITPAQYNAFDDGDGELTDSEVRDGIQTYVQNSITGDSEVDGVAFSDDEIRALISGYIQSQLG